MTRTLRLACLVVLLTSPLLASPGAPAYSVVGLPSLPAGLFGRALAINERTQIVGQSLLTVPSRFDFKGVLWDAGQIRDLGNLPGGTESTANSINNRGQIVLSMEALLCHAYCSHAVLWEKGTKTDLGAIGESATAHDINDKGQIVGQSFIGAALFSPRRAVLWDGGAIIELGTLPGDDNSSADAINNRGQIIGWSGSFEGTRPFLWEDGVMTEVLGLSWVSDINERGQIVGSLNGTPAIWEKGIVTPLALPLGSWGLLNAAINATGQVAGTLGSPSNEVRIAVAWQNGTPFVLPRLAPTGWTQAFGINNRGEIVGDGGGGQAALWVPNGR